MLFRSSFMDGATAKVMNEHFQVIKMYKCRHGYRTDPHEFIMLPNGHVLLIAEDSQLLDLSEIVEGGKTNVNVVGTHIQELDADKNVVFEWRCWDNFNIRDALNIPLTGKTVHYVHMNALDVDYDGNLIVSSRHLDEVTKIDRRTGEIIWRLGGANNQFTFVDDPDQFSHQHHVRVVPSKPGHYTMMDNGNHHSPPYSRAVEYKLDEEQKIATKVWEYRHDPDRYTHWMGSVQRLPSGNTLIGWAHEKLPKVTEVTPQGSIVYEGDFIYSETAYRSHRYEWSGCAKQPEAFVESEPDRLTLMFNQFGDCSIEQFYIYADTTELPTTLVDSTTENVFEFTDLQGPNTYYFRVTSIDSDGQESDFSNQVSAFVRFVAPDSNILDNGDFSSGLNEWEFVTIEEELATASVDENNRLHIEIAHKGDSPEDVALYQSDIPLFELKTYKLEFDAYANTNRPLQVRLTDSLGRYDYSMFGLIALTRRLEHFEFEFLMDDYTDPAARLCFALAQSAGDVYIDNISLQQVSNTEVKSSQQSPTRFRILANYPNPFNAQTTVLYELPHEADVEIRVFDVLGRTVEHQHNGLMRAGTHEFRWNAESEPSGLYFCSIHLKDARGKQLSKMLKMMLMK